MKSLSVVKQNTEQIIRLLAILERKDMKYSPEMRKKFVKDKILKKLFENENVLKRYAK